MKINIEEINTVLDEESPDNLILQSYDVRGRKLVLAFTCNGGPKEDEAYVVSFEQAIIFHLPSVLYKQVRFRKTTEAEREQLIPEVSYDTLEVSGRERAYTVLLLTNQDGKAYGYYIAADSVSAEWVPKVSCLEVW